MSHKLRYLKLSQLCLIITFILSTVTIFVLWILAESSDTAAILNVYAESNNATMHNITKSDCLYDDTIILVIISCGRWNYLSQTIDSFEEYNTYKCLKRKIVIDDCNDINGMNKMSIKYKKYGYEFFRSTTSRNSSYAETTVRLILSIYEAIVTYSKIYNAKTNSREYVKYIFQIEDDWKFYKHGFIEDSLSILKTHRHSHHFKGNYLPKYRRISMVYLRNYQIYEPFLDVGEFCGGALREKDIDKIYNTTFKGYHKNLHYFLNQHEYRNCYHRWSTNPGLKYVKLLRRQIEKCIDKFNDKNLFSSMEHCVSYQYRQDGYTMACPIMYDGYVGHLGRNSHVNTQTFGDGISRRIMITDLTRINNQHSINISNCQYTNHF